MNDEVIKLNLERKSDEELQALHDKGSTEERKLTREVFQKRGKQPKESADGGRSPR